MLQKWKINIEYEKLKWNRKKLRTIRKGLNFQMSEKVKSNKGAVIVVDGHLKEEHHVDTKQKNDGATMVNMDIVTMTQNVVSAHAHTHIGDTHTHTQKVVTIG